MAETEAKQRARESIETFLKVYGEITKEKNYQGYDKRFFEDIRLIDADPSGGATWELDVTEYWSNLNDMCTAISMNPVTKPGYWYFLQGVSRSLNLSYLKGIPTGTTIRIKCTTLQHGRTMAMLRGVMESVDGKIVYATAEHHKVATPAKPEFAEKLMKERERVELMRRQKL
ncbi:hypothetical protein TEQG_02185 [Trichophyton equinum CBS 127.97]|uniref:Thioesterase domain-containing protein n=1 Tax=Trichophyton equinum (strain ATCC MYA-4606 / CBS 127.97) TaxID=559882 RepID=F2PM69_TRIEC|nr:hypothetical protein TEQG_02185 [Trichophyton equinum CBS 127.97]